ncbi:MAG: hypothetical protein H7A23_22755 [Leptospiraceae bacterium]|nr:hypothetical protein [Leptospiraceae bacterium]MCP5497385.1 hypothetical protein [Leptospiraceae bacterium]
MGLSTIYKSLFIFLFLFFCSYNFAQEGDVVPLAWDNVEGADYYIVEVKDRQGNLVLNKKTRKNEIDLNLPPGNYRSRIGVKRHSGNISWSKWKFFKSKVYLSPIVESEKIKPITVQDGNSVLKIRGKNFLPETKIFLKSENNTVRIRDFQYKNDNLIEIKFDVSSEDIGEYDLVVENPNNKIYTVKDFLVIQNVEETMSNSQANPDLNPNNNPNTRPNNNSSSNSNNRPNTKPSNSNNNPNYKPNNNDIYSNNGYNNGPASRQGNNFDSFRWEVFKRSAVMPGWGQNYRRDPDWKVYAYPAMLFFGSALYVKAYQDNKKSKKKFNSGLQSLFAAQALDSGQNTTLQAYSLYSFSNLLSTRSKVNQYYRQGTTIAAVILGIYLFNLFDALFLYDYSHTSMVNKSSGFLLDATYNKYSNSQNEIQYEAGYYFKF